MLRTVGDMVLLRYSIAGFFASISNASISSKRVGLLDLILHTVRCGPGLPKLISRFIDGAIGNRNMYRRI